MLIGPWVQQLLIRRPFLRNLLHKLFSGNQPLLNQQLRQASVCARLETRNSSIVTGLLSGSAIVLPHLITLSARKSRDCGIVTPICFAVARFTTSSYLVGCSTGSSAGLVPFRTLPASTPTRRNSSVKLGP